MNKKLTYADGQLWSNRELIAAHSDEYIDIDTEKISDLLELTSSAVATSYDNRLSGLIADNVQDAIDEVHEELEDRAGIYYSTEERIVGKWIDGRDVFQKTYVVINPITGRWASIPLDTIIEEIIDLSGTAKILSGSDINYYGIFGMNTATISERILVVVNTTTNLLEYSMINLCTEFHVTLKYLKE